MSVARSGAWTIWLVAHGLIAISLYHIWLNFGSDTPDRWGFPGAEAVIVITSASPGLLIALKRPKSPLGWLVLSMAVITAVQGALIDYLVHTVTGGQPVSSLTEYLAWSHSLLWVGIMTVAFLILLLFPTGHLQGHRWRPVMGFGLIAAATTLIGLMFAPGPLQEFPTIDNPAGIAGLATLFSVLENGGAGLIGLSVLLALVSTGLRFHRSVGAQRQQMKWLAFGAAFIVLFFCAYVLGFIIGMDATAGSFMKVLEAGIMVSIAFMFLTISVAILRHRLFDIDLVINRTLVYVPLTALLGGFYVGGIQLVRLIFTNLTGIASDAVIIVTVFIVASLFTPMRSSLQGFVDRTFKELHDPIREMRRFSANVRSVLLVLDPHEITLRFLEESVAAFQARGGSISVLRNDTKETLHSSGDATPVAVVPIVHGGLTVGELELGPRVNGAPYSERDIAALSESAADVARALVLSNAIDR